jgi:hypothetical protein
MRCFTSLLLILVIASSCNSKKGNSSSRDHRYSKPFKTEANDIDQKVDEYSDGTWCAEVEYFNPNTGTRNTYSLNVEVENDELVKINWPNGGWLDESHFIAEDISSGECSFMSDRGYEYTILLKEKGGCSFSDENLLRYDIERDIRKITCPQCGKEKKNYNSLCSDCQNSAETCPKCYGFKFDWEKICSSCVDEMQIKEDETDNDFK